MVSKKHAERDGGHLLQDFVKHGHGARQGAILRVNILLNKIGKVMTFLNPKLLNDRKSCRE